MGSARADTLLITGGRIVDGTGSPWFYGDLILSGDTIAGIVPSRSQSQPDAKIIDATGMVVCPGFIDIQSHSIVPFLSDRRSLSKLTQGVTTEIMGEGVDSFAIRWPHRRPVSRILVIHTWRSRRLARLGPLVDSVW